MRCKHPQQNHPEVCRNLWSALHKIIAIHVTIGGSE